MDINRRSATPTGDPLWLLLEPDPIYAVMHTPDGASATGTAVLMLPPFGWDNDCSYRGRREWALALARAGHTALRIDLPGTEESVGSPLDPGRYQSWLEAVEDCARWLRSNSGCGRLVVLGVGLGGYLGYQAAALGAPIDDLILWGVHARGRTYVRELRAYADIVAAGLKDPSYAARNGSELAIGGHTMTAETTDAIGELRLDEMALPAAERRRVLLIERDAHGVDRRLSAHLEEMGVDLTIVPSGNEYEIAMAHAELSQTPSNTISRSVDWLAEANSSVPEQRPSTTDVRAATEICFEHSGQMIRERLTTLKTPDGELAGIIAEPLDGHSAEMCVVSANAGALRRTGPNRLITRIARNAAAAGFVAGRWDLPGLGDSDGTYPRRTGYTLERERATVAAMQSIFDHMETESGASQLSFVGICSGAYWGMRAALNDRRVALGVSVNLAMFKWTPRHAELAKPTLVTRRTQFNLLAMHMAQWRAARGALNRLAENRTRMVFMFSDREPMYLMLRVTGMLKRIQRSPKMSARILGTHDHDLRPLWIQDEVLQVVDATLQETPSPTPATAG